MYASIYFKDMQLYIRKLYQTFKDIIIAFSAYLRKNNKAAN